MSESTTGRGTSAATARRRPKPATGTADPAGPEAAAPGPAPAEPAPVAPVAPPAPPPRKRWDKPPDPGSPEWAGYWEHLGGEADAIDSPRVAALATIPPPPPPPAREPQPAATERPQGTPPAVVALAVLVVLALAGGGLGLWWVARDDGVSKAEFIESAEELCRPGNGPVTALLKPTSYAELAAASGTVVAAADSQLRQLRALPRPAGAAGREAEAVFEALGGTSAAARQLQGAANALADGNTIAATKQVSAEFRETAALADAYGFTACATGMQPGINTLLSGSNAVIKANFVAQADSICRGVANTFAKIPEPRNSGLPELMRYLNATIAANDKAVEDLKALPVPPGDEVAVGEIFTAQDKVTAMVKDMRDAALRGDVNGVIAAERQLGPLGSAVDTKWDSYGLSVCGSNFGEL